MLMLFLVFLKTDLVQVIKRMKNYRQMALVAFLLMIAIPLLFFGIVVTFNRELAVGVLLLASMPAAASSPALTDIVKGNTALSTSLVIVTSITAIFTVPLLFLVVQHNDVAISPLVLLRDIAVIIVVPMVTSQIVKKYFSEYVKKRESYITSVNIIILSLMVFIAMGSQREAIIGNFKSVLWQIIFLYAANILLHVIGYTMGAKEKKKERIALTIATAYRNNGMALVLAANYLNPSVLLLVVLSDLPWNTLLIPFRKFLQNKK